ncbi:MAG: hypothetical protein WA946_13715 [Nitrospirota bacterium]
MKKTSTIVIGIMLLTFISAFVLAKSGLDVATPQAEEQVQEKPSDQTSANSQPTSGNVSISKRNKAKLELEQQKKLRQEQIDKEKAAEAAPQ